MQNSIERSMSSVLCLFSFPVNFVSEFSVSIPKKSLICMVFWMVQIQFKLWLLKDLIPFLANSSCFKIPCPLNQCKQKSGGIQSLWGTVLLPSYLCAQNTRFIGMKDNLSLRGICTNGEWWLTKHNGIYSATSETHCRVEAEDWSH